MTKNTPILVGIAADDLTSATDGAAPFLAKGYAPLISRNPAGFHESAVASIDTNGRASSALQSTCATEEAISALSNARFLLKTVDSTLRGHIREEIAAAFHASRRSKLVVAPAFPEAGRLTVNGIQIVHDIPVSESTYGRDPVHPSRTSRIADLIDPAIGQPAIISHEDRTRPLLETPILILDADSQDVLNRQVARIPEPELVLWVGSPGLAIALASLVPVAQSVSHVSSRSAGRTLIVAGSANPVTHRQCDALQVQGVPIVRDMAAAPDNAHVLCLGAPPQRQGNAAIVLANIADQAAAAVCGHGGYDVVIATGGETMAAILDRLGISRFVLTGELEPGFPVGRAQRPDGTWLTIAMKAGGFGSETTLLRAASVLSGSTFSRKAVQ